MIGYLSLLLQATPPPAPPPPQPQRSVPDSGVIATTAQVTPAGVQSVFEARVTGVRFGKRPGEIWVAANWAAYRLDWRNNAMLANARLENRAGVQGVAIDPVTGGAIVSGVGKTFAFDSTGAANFTWTLGSHMAGGVAVAARANASGRRVAVVPLPANDSLAVIDADRGSLVKMIPLGVLPVAAAINEDGSRAWVTNLGGRKPSARSRAAKQCCDAFAELVRVDARGIAEAGDVSEVDLVAGAVRTVITVGRHPTGLAWDEQNGRLYVANGNSDTVSVIDTKARTRLPSIAIAPFRERKIGFAPTDVEVSPDGITLFVTLGGLNAVGVYALPGGQFRGLIPTGWYPSSIDVSADGSTIAVGTLFGIGSGSGRTSGMQGKYVHSYRGSVNVIAVPSDAELGAYTTSVARNNRLTLGAPPPQAAQRPRNVVPRAVPERPGEPSLIEHVVYIIRENRTYDQVFGDIGRGASDSSLVQYGRDITPNAHALADRYVLFDHFFASGGNSADGHNWLTQANETEYPMWPLYEGRSYPSEGQDPLAYSSGGFLWEAAESKGKTVRVFGEYAPAPQVNSDSLRIGLIKRFLDTLPTTGSYFRSVFGKRYNVRSDIPSLDRVLVREYPGWTMEVPDVAKAAVFLEHLREWEAGKGMPNLVMMNLPSDHTEGTNPGWCTPKACVADNDLALGMIVEGLSHSRFWKSMAIFIVEDDAQNGVDHIDGHRTVALIASPYARRGTIDPTFYAFPSLLKTIELMLGLPALSMFDLVATDMRASFIEPDESPDFTPFTALVPRHPLDEVNQRVGSITGPHAAARRRAAQASARMRFNTPDAAPSDLLNKILWHDARGWDKPFPGVKRSLFFPMAVDIADEDRDDR